FDPQRLARSKEFLLRCGGVESILYPADGGAEIRSMGFKSADFFKHFVEEFDAKRAKISLQDPRTGKTEQRAVLIPHQECSQFYEEMGKFYLPLIDIQTPEGIVKGALLPESPILTPAQKAPCIFHSHS